MPHPLELIRRIAHRHGLVGEPHLLPSSGMVNDAWLIGQEHVLRIIRDEEEDEEAEREGLVVPLVRAAGIRTPRLVAADTSCELAPRPYTVYERAAGTLLGEIDEPPQGFPELYRELGREMARLHRLDVTPEVRVKLRSGSLVDPPRQLAKSLGAGVMTAVEADRIQQALDQLEPLLATEAAPRLVHRDIHPWNVFVDPQTRRLTAIIDWGDTAWGDPSLDFASMPIQALPGMLDGYREAGGVLDAGLVARALWMGLGVALWEIRDLDAAIFKRQWWRMPPDGPEGAALGATEALRSALASH